MNRAELTEPNGVRWIPDQHRGAGTLVLGGSSGRIDEQRARLFAEQGCIAESVQWFGGPGQNPGPWEIPLETFLARIEGLTRDCDRVYIAGTSFGAEAALATAARTPRIAGAIAFAPSDVVWAGVTPDGRQVSHWTLGGDPLPFVPFDESWVPGTDPPAFRGLYLSSREASPARAEAAAIAVERIPVVITVAGGDDQVWPSVPHAGNIQRRRSARGLGTTVITDAEAGHRTVLPGESVVSAGMYMRRGGSEEADRRLGDAAWPAIRALIGARDS
ncbi:MAG TPA: acyl-CoA thioester hydrolase/BAAT C-terminal domain-containing protein [Trebonia sp.]|nr:acyl-CoA thioester hydrolase/BAAT C-terminal domain-containing protein [Trebonia sp.]